MADRASADRACKDPNPIIDGRKANVNLAYLGAKPRVIQPGECLRLSRELEKYQSPTWSSASFLRRVCLWHASDPPGLHPETLRVRWSAETSLTTLSQCHLSHIVSNMSFCHLPPPVKSWMRTCECWRVLICLALTVTEVHICPQTKFTGLDFMLSVSLWSDRVDNG